MAACIYIIISLLLYPVIGYFTIRLTTNSPKTQKQIVWLLCIVSTLVIVALLTHIITISQNLNWFLVTSVYLTISMSLWLPRFKAKHISKSIGTVLRFLIFGFGYLLATVGFPFVIFTSFDLDTDQAKWLNNSLIYNERNIGQGPDPSVRLKEIEVYKTMALLPVFAYRIKVKVYDEQNLPLSQNLGVRFSKKDEKLYLSSVVNGYKTFIFADSIQLKQ
jgi:hypothetical protein